MSIPAGTYRLGPRDGTLSVRTGRTGAAAKAGHDLLIHVTAWQATLEVGEDPAQISIGLDADATSLRVREGTGGMQPLGDDDKESIEQTIDEEVLKRQAVEFRSTEVRTADGGPLSVQGELTLVGEARPIAFELTVDAGSKLSGSAVVKQTDWGITPYSALFGALKVSDEVEVALDAGLPSSVESWMSSQEIKPRELKPALLELYGISRASVQAQYSVYQGYVNKRNEILRDLAAADLGGADQVYSELRTLKVELSFAISGIKNHELYFEHLGGKGGDPRGAVARLIKRDFGSVEDWRADLKATGLSSLGWAWTAYDWDERRLFNYIGDSQDTFPIWNATPLVALDLDEHAYFLDYQTDRGAYIDAFFDNLDWAVVNDWVTRYRIPLR
ncbi:MAG: Fe-Mn family superoxide dismutase [Gaiellaceae bacterium]